MKTIKTMKLTKRYGWRLLAVLTLVLALTLAACGGATESTPTTAGTTPETTALPDNETTALPDDVVLRLQADAESNPTDEFWLEVISDYEAANPGVTIEYVPPPSAGERNRYAQTLLATGEFPDVSINLNIQEFKDVLLPFDLTDPVVESLNNVEQVLIDGQLLGLGPSVQIWSGIFYNKELFDQAGIASPPANFEEFEAALEALDSIDVLPIVTAGEWVSTLTYMALNDILSYNVCWYGERMAGDVSFSEPEWVEATERFARWVDAGYFGETSLGRSYAEANQLFLSGDGAMYPMGSWLLGIIADADATDFEIGWFPAPTRDGELRATGVSGGKPVAVWKDTAHPEAAQAFATYLVTDRDTITEWLNSVGDLPNVSLPDGPFDISPDPAPKPDILATVNSVDVIAPAYNGQGDCAMVPGFDSVAIKGLADTLLVDGGAVDVSTALAELDEFWESGG